MFILYRILILISFLIIGYLFGSIPNSVIIGKLFFKKDVMEEGSKNPGGTNAGRVLGKTAGVVVILLDGIKTILPMYLAFYCFYHCNDIMYIMGYFDDTTLNVFGRGNTLCQLAVYLTSFGAIIGHCYSIFLKFQGGKAVSSYLATACGLTYITFPFCGAIFFGLLKIKKHVSLSSISCTAAFTVFAWVMYICYACGVDLNILNYFMWFGNGPEITIYLPILMTFAFVLLVLRHRSNIQRLKTNTERKITWMK